MLVHELLCLLGVQENREAIVMIPTVRVARVSELPVHVGHLLLQPDSLPPANRLRPRDIGHRAQVLLAGLIGHPPVFLREHGLPGAAAGRRMVPDPLVRPRDGLAPPVRVRVEGAEVDALEAQLAVEVAAVAAAVEPIAAAGIEVEPALAAPRHQVVGVEALDVRAHLVDPAAERLRRAVVAPRQVPDAVGAAARLVGQLPREDGGRVLVAGDYGLDIALVGSLDLGKAVELRSADDSVSSVRLAVRFR